MLIRCPVSKSVIMPLWLWYGTQCTQQWVKMSMYVEALLHFYIQLNDWITFNIQTICCVCSILMVWSTKHHWPSIDRHHCSASLHHRILKLCEQFMHSAVMLKFPSLEAAVGNAQYSFWFCPKCQSADDVSWHHHPAHCWATVLHCGPCNISWTICWECFSIRSHYTKSNQVNLTC